MRNTFTLAAIATLIALAPAAAQAATECQGAQAVGGGSTAASAWQDWQANVANAYGPAWTKLELAQNRNVGAITLPGLFGPDITTYTAVAVPCRTVRVTAGIVSNIGTMGVMQTDEPSPKAFGAVKTYKLSTFN